MPVLLRLSSAIDRLNSALGRWAAWLVVAMVLVGAWNAIARHVGRDLGVQLASNALLETQWYLFSVVFLLAAAWTLATNRHVRVDVLHSRLGERTRAWIDLVGTLAFLLPTCAVAVLLSWGPVASSFAVREVSPDPGGLPRWPLKALVPLAFVLLFLQGISEAVRRVAFLRGLVASPAPVGADVGVEEQSAGDARAAGPLAERDHDAGGPGPTP